VIVIESAETVPTQMSMPLTPTVDPGHHHFETGDIYFYMNNGDQRVRCGVTILALELLEPELPPTREGRIQAFNQRRTRIERFDRGELEPDDRTVLVRATDLV
jgi:Protein of unknown function (DUF1488)